MRAAIRACVSSAALIVAISGPSAPVFAQVSVSPDFDIWDAQIGTPVGDLPYLEVGDVACGTNGGPPSLPLESFADYTKCTPEDSGLREVYFTYDDEQELIAKAWDSDYTYLQRATSVYAHPVTVSVLVDDKGIIKGQRVVTDDRVPDNVRRTQVALARNLEARFSGWNLDCTDIPPADGEKPVGRMFTHRICTGEDPDSGNRMRMEAEYLRRPGQTALNPNTQEVSTGSFSSAVRLEIVAPPYEPTDTSAE